MAQEAEAFPSPSNGQVVNRVSPYTPNHADPARDALDLSAQMQVGATNSHQHHDGGAVAGAGIASAVTQHLDQDGYYAPPPQASTPQPFQGPIPGISGPLPSSTGDESARKKTKVTRACDECRRKKIKCDAESDGPDAPRCSNCNRTNAECKFSRAPQKRGPSKGYIKELSDRVAQLERGGPGFDFDSGSPMPPAPPLIERKRTLSMAEDTSFDSPALEKYRSETTKSFAPVAVPEANMGPPPPPAAKVKSLGIELATPDTYAPQPLRPLHQVENHHLELLMAKINRFYPLLGSRDGINANLQYCPPPLRQAFYYAVGSVVGTMEFTSGEQTRLSCANNVYNMMNAAAPPGPLSERMNPPESRPWQANLVYLQMLLLLILHQESTGPMHDDPFGAFTKDQLLQQARRLIDYLQLRHVTEVAHLGSTSSDASRVFSAARRAYWIFVVLDIWNSLAGRSARQLPFMSVDAELTAADRSVLGDEFFHFVRKSAVAAMIADQMKSFRVQAPELSTLGYWMLAMQHTSASTIDATAGGVSSSSASSSPGPTLKTAPLAVIAQATTDLFCAMLVAGGEPCPPTRAVVDAACKLAALLAALDNVPEGTPLVHHFVIVAAKALVDASRFPPHRKDVTPALQDLLIAVRGKGLLDTSPWRDHVAGAILDVLEDDKADVHMGGGADHPAEAGAAAGGAADGEGAGPSADDMDAWKSVWPLVIWEGYLRNPIQNPVSKIITGRMR